MELYSAGKFVVLQEVPDVQLRRYFQTTSKNAAMDNSPLALASCIILTFFVNPNHKFAIRLGEYNPATSGGGVDCVRMDVETGLCGRQPQGFL